MRYFVLYNERGIPQRVAATRNASDANEFLAAGFDEVSQEVYEDAATQVESVETSDLARLLTVGGALGLLLERKARTNIPPPRTEQIDALILGFKQRIDRHTANLLSGEMTMAQWFGILTREVRKLHLAAGALGAGGWQNLGGQAMEKVLSQVREQVDYMERFKAQMLEAEQEGRLPSDAALLARAKQYGEASRGTVSQAYGATIGLPNLPAWPGVQTDCYSNCKCDWRIVRLPGNGNWDCYWVISPVENCNTCLARRRAFDPLQIRGGVILPYNTAGIFR